MGFVAIFVPGTKYITCDELAEYVEESKAVYDANHDEPLNSDGHRVDPSVNQAEARNMLQKQKRKFLLLDARRKDEFCVSHIYNATNVHSTFTHGKDAIKELNERLEQVCDKDTLLVMYCAVGLRSAWLAKHLTSQGYTNAKVLYHGFYEWTNEGRPIYGQNCVSVQPVPPNSSPKTPKTSKAHKTTKNSAVDSPIHSASLSPPHAPSSSPPSQAQQSSLTQQPNVSSPRHSPTPLVEASVTGVCLCQLQAEVVHMCNHPVHGCLATQRVAPQHYIASLALKQTLSTKYKFPSWLSSHRSIAPEPVAPLGPSSM